MERGDGISFGEGAAGHLTIRRPPDWVGDQPVTVLLLLRPDGPSSTAGRAGFRLQPRDYSDDQPLQEEPFIDSEVVVLRERRLREVAVTVPAATLQGDWWDFELERAAGVTDGYNGLVTIVSVAVEYPTAAR